MALVDQLAGIFSTLTIEPHTNQGITVLPAFNDIHGVRITKAVLAELVTKTSVLYLSGGKTPQTLYKEIAEEELVHPGAVAQVDERYGPKWHEHSNEHMIQETGLLRYFEMLGVPVKLILESEDREKTAEDYDMTVRQLIARYQKQIALMGIGADGHTAGIARDHDEFHNPLFDASQKTLLVSSFDDPTGPLGERVTMTFTGLSMMDILIITVFGPDKGTALEKMFQDGPEEDIPARFYKRPDIAPRTLLITDQKA